MQSNEQIHNEQDLLAATGLTDRSDLADALWAYVDGVVHYRDDGIDLQPGFQTDQLSYPFRLQDLYVLAAKLEEAEVALQGGAGRPLSKARQAKNAHAAFAPEAERLAGAVLGPDFRVFAPRAMTTFAWWFEDRSASKLAAVIAPTEVDTVTDEVLAYALAWQQDRELILIASDKHAAEVTRRLPWLDVPVTVLTLTGQRRAQDRIEVLAAATAHKARTVKPFELDAGRSSWIARLLADPIVAKLDAHARASYLSWHHRGLQVLRVTRTRGGLRVQAGVRYSRPQPGHKTFETVLTAPLTDSQLELAVEAVAGSVSSGGSRTTRQTEHRLQAALAGASPTALGLPLLAREYPAHRGPGRPGYIDFLGCEANGNLHVVETKVGHDPKIVLQALDYGIWVHANDSAIRQSRPNWPDPVVAQSRMYLDFVLAAGDDATAVGPYLASQLEVLGADVCWRVFVVPDLDARPLQIEHLAASQLWTQQSGVVSRPVRPPRAAAH